MPDITPREAADIVARYQACGNHLTVRHAGWQEPCRVEWALGIIGHPGSQVEWVRNAYGHDLLVMVPDRVPANPADYAGWVPPPHAEYTTYFLSVRNPHPERVITA